MVLKAIATNARLDDLRSRAAEIEVDGERVLATTAGAAYLPDYDALLVADLHFEKGTSFARRGILLPPYDTRTTLKRLGVLISVFKPGMVVSLGDAFHDGEAEARMDDEDAARLDDLMTKTNWIWIVGNHDPEPPARFAAHVEQEMALGRLVLRHEPTEGPAAGEVAGHLHPCAKVRAGSRLIRRRCFASDGTRLILPAFGAYTGGLNILDKAYDGMFEPRRAWVLGGKGVYPIEEALLAPDEPKMSRMAG